MIYDDLHHLTARHIRGLFFQNSGGKVGQYFITLNPGTYWVTQHKILHFASFQVSFFFASVYQAQGACWSPANSQLEIVRIIPNHNVLHIMHF